MCLVLTLFSGVVPAQGIVVCLEADGCVRIESKAVDGACDGCDTHQENAATESGAQDEMCPCVDIDVPGADQSPRPRDPSLEQWAQMLVPPTRAWRITAVEPQGRSVATNRPRPRPPDALLMIQSVVLLR